MQVLDIGSSEYDEIVDIVTRSDFFGGVRLASFGTERAYFLEGYGSRLRIDRMEYTLVSNI